MLYNDLSSAYTILAFQCITRVSRNWYHQSHPQKHVHTYNSVRYIANQPYRIVPTENPDSYWTTNKQKRFYSNRKKNPYCSVLLTTEIINYHQSLITVNPMSMLTHISIFYLRPYIISHNSQSGYIMGTLKHKFGLKLRWRIGKNGSRLIINFANELFHGFLLLVSTP
jgi:hypothetical protein